MVEIKCPYSRVPTSKTKIQYWMQMQLQMECCDMEVCDFLDIVVREYGNRDAYINDRYPPLAEGSAESDPDFVYSRGASGLPKGIMIERNLNNHQTGDVKRKYYYTPVLHFQSEQEENQWLNEWASEIYKEVGESPERMFGVLAGQTETYTIRYWYIEQWNSTPIYRDRVWFAKRYPDFKQFWDLVQKYRSEGIIPDKIDRDDTSGSALSRSSSSFPTGGGGVQTLLAPLSATPKSSSRTKVDPIIINGSDECMFTFGDDD
jgi:hypothetical protein